MKSLISLVSLSLLLGMALPPALPGTPTAASVSLGTTVISEGDDFATRVLAMPWDMNAGPYPDFPTVLHNIDRASFSASGGLWSFTTLTDPSVWLQFPNIQGTQHVLKLGDVYPINAAKYKLLSFRMCSSVADEFVTYWYNAPLSVAPAFGNSPAVNTINGCKVYVVNMSQISPSGLAWSGNLAGFRLDPANLHPNVSVQLDWLRLTTADTSNFVPINWSGVTSGTTLDFYLSLDGTCSTTNAAPVGTTPRSGSSSGTFNWGNSLQPNPTAATPFPLPESFQPGPYKVVMLVDNAGTPVCASSPLEIHQAPLLTIQKPSYTSGPDYATQVVGDPWGMDSKVDVGSAVNIYNTTAINGIFNGTTNTGGDPNVYLHTTAPIDTNKYKYVTYSYYLEGTQNIATGWISRFFWWYQGIFDTVTLSDTIVYEGWHTYSIDLSKAMIEPAAPQGRWTGSPTVFRFDPDEVPATMIFHIDFMTLTGDESVPAGTPFPIVYQATPASGVTVTLYYDTDTDPTNGRTLMNHYAPPPPSSGPFSLFLPILTNNFPPDINLLTGTTWMWDTTGVSPATYYVSADINDGVMTTTWHSELPVTVMP